jgi:tRNA dimethylallyltransferase
LVIVGPTAAGKSRLAMDAARALDGEIISADSVQVYRGLNIGSAKPSLSDRGQVKHWCVDIVGPSEPFDAAAWVHHATRAIDNIHTRGKVPIVAGGTGFYVRALLSGLHEVEGIKEDVRERVREELIENGPETMHEELEAVDPEAAQRISPTDPQRIGRALEVYRSTGIPLSEHFKRTRPVMALDPLTVGLWPSSREILYAAIETRAARMIEAGLVEEVRDLLELQIPHDSGPLTALGYRQVVEHLRHSPTKPLLDSIATAHRQYARRQLTWFRGITTRENALVHIDSTTCEPLSRLLELWGAGTPQL